MYIPLGSPLLCLKLEYATANSFSLMVVIKPVQLFPSFIGIHLQGLFASFLDFVLVLLGLLPMLVEDVFAQFYYEVDSYNITNTITQRTQLPLQYNKLNLNKYNIHNLILTECQELLTLSVPFTISPIC